MKLLKLPSLSGLFAEKIVIRKFTCEKMGLYRDNDVIKMALIFPDEKLEEKSKFIFFIVKMCN